MACLAIEFDKTLQERLYEYKEIFLSSSGASDETFNSQKRVTSYLMKEFWGNHLSVVLYSEGWKAIWKVPIGKCILMNLEHPSNVLVEVISIDWINLEAHVQVLKINEHYVPSSKRFAALCELYPVEDQTTGCDPWIIANELDKYRFFNEYLWYPWDENEDDCWTESRLEQRIQLLYDMVVGEINLEDSERIRQLISDARHLQVEIKKTAQNLEELEESEDLNVNSDTKDLEELRANLHRMCMQEQDGDGKKEKEEMLMVQLFLLRRQLKDIQYEFEALENPVIRKAMANAKLKDLRREYLLEIGEFNCNHNENEISNVAIVCGTSVFQEIRGFLDYAESKFSKGAKYTLRFFNSLQCAIDSVDSKRTSYLVSPGVHCMKFTEDLLNPGTILAGFPEEMGPTPSVIKGHSLGMTMIVIDWDNGQCLPNEKQESANLEYLHFDPVGIEAILFVDHGSISVKFCSFGHEKDLCDLPVIGAHSSPSTSVLHTNSLHQSLWKAIQSGRGENVRLPLPPLPISAAFECPKQRGIAVGAHGKLKAKECHFKGLHLAIIAYSGAKVSLSNCKFSKCQVAIRISKGAEVSAENCIFENSVAYSIQYCAGAHEEQDEEVKKVMEGKEEVIASSQILQRIPGVTFKECIFISHDSHDVCLSSISEIVTSTKMKETTSISKEKNVIVENADEDFEILDEAEEDSVIILSDEN